MTASNDSILVTPGTGATVATHLVNSKEHQVVMVADEYGSIQGSAGGATAGAILGTRHIFTEETNAGAALAAMFGAEFIDPRYPVILRQNEGLRFVQGSVVSVGTLNFEITFEVI